MNLDEMIFDNVLQNMKHMQPQKHNTLQGKNNTENLVGSCDHSTAYPSARRTLNPTSHKSIRTICESKKIWRKHCIHIRG